MFEGLCAELGQNLKTQLLLEIYNSDYLQVLRVRLRDNKVADIEEVYVNNGSVVTGSSVALYKNNKLFIGTVSAQLVMCDVNYLPN